MKKLLAFLISGALALSMVACGGGEPAPAPEGGEAAGGTISIGAVLPLTGSSTGEYLKAAMEVAEDIINNSHDLDWDLAKNEGVLGGQKIEIKFADHQASAEVATTEAANLLDAGVVAITGAYNSGCSASVATQALEYGVPMVCGSSSSASLTDGTTYSFGSIFNRVAAND
ncbi:MAG: hypothetical protein E7488_08655, partial [Ruminococcaceae bacterium]|nr:hypothetical protein [Oscillospiraceae bacterium]